MYESVNSASSAPGDFESGGSAYAYRKWCGIRRSTWLLVIYILTYLSFLVVGGYLMGVIEEDNEQRLKREVHNKKRDFLSRNPTVSSKFFELGINYLKLSKLPVCMQYISKMYSRLQKTERN